ncbi:unnamed protein product [Psylliodes chrysocephalus]|uniref:U3 small nucleolar ribonucleoprotein protein MPP10 n=1 Tax=Psylliodes chrysocephalus TaxID=3402493 RepID=A0A9P0CQJ0_9CUCU|nr:unnamed protein product [Psylliodes chrysocephala]
MSTPVVSLEKSLEHFHHLTKKPELFLNSENALYDSVKIHLKEIYDFAKTQEKKLNGSKGLSKLLIQKFDTEQIWQEIELQNDGILTKSLTDVTKLVVNKNKLVFTNLIDENKLKDVDDDGEENENELENMSDIDNASDEEDDKNDEAIYSHNSDDDEEEMEVDNAGEGLDKFTNKKKSVLDDNFFKLDEMETFLNNEDKKEMNPNAIKNTEESDSDEEESIDLFEEDEANLEEETDKSRTAKFKDFFRSNEPQRKEIPKRNKFLEEMSDNDGEQVPKSSLELRQERLQKRIEQIEKNAIAEKPWALKGEILGDNRPQNSLLEEILEFDLTSKPAPVITENTTLQLEDIIKQRIKDKVFDSVVRKVKPVETPLEYKKKLTLDQEKSKHSLAQIYEKEYLDQKAALDSANVEKEEEEPAVHKEIKTMMRDLFNKLDALSNFHFTPKPALPELRIVNNLPAINMEEVAPVTATEASLLAPEEIGNKPKGDILGNTEKMKTDKNRERRKKKLKQKKHKEIISKNMLSNGKAKGKVKMSEVLKNRNTQKMEETSSKGIKSSKAFFTQLQEQAQVHIGKKLQSSGKKKDKNKIEAKKIKL